MTDQIAQTYLLSCVTDRVDDCKGPLSDEECVDALSGIARGKAPGFDGLPMEFYLLLWDVLGRRSCGGSEFLLPVWFPW